MPFDSPLSKIIPERAEVDRLVMRSANKPVYAIAAVAENGVIGRGLDLPWDIPEDWQYFVEMTRGGLVIEGRRCFERFSSLRADCLTFVLSRNPALAVDGAVTAGSLAEALASAHSVAGPGPVWICGGAAVYAEALEQVDRLYLTEIRGAYDGDVFFPPWRHLFGRCLSRRESTDGSNRYAFCVYERT